MSKNDRPTFDLPEEKPSFGEGPSDPQKPSFTSAKEELFEIEEEETRRRLPSRKAFAIAAGVVLIIVAGFIAFRVLGNGESAAPAPEVEKQKSQSKEISATIENFYQLLDGSSEDFCSFFAEGVFDTDDPLRACSAWSRETLSNIPTITGTIQIKEDPSQALALYKLSTDQPISPENTSPAESAPPVESASPNENISPTESTSPTENISPINPESAPPAESAPPVDPQNPQPTPRGSNAKPGSQLQGGAVLILQEGEWKIATLAGIPGTTASSSELQEILSEEYELLRQGPLYNLPDQIEKPEPTKSIEKEKQLPTSGLSCPSPEKFDLVADVRSGNFGLFREQGAATGGDIVSASHSFKRERSCLFVQFRGNYASVENLSLSLEHTSWQGQSPASLLIVFPGGAPQGSVISRGRERPVEISFDSSSNGKRVRILFSTPQEWNSGPRQFWFLRSEFSDPLGSGGQLFDEGRPPGQMPPDDAKNLKGGWPF